MKKIINRFLMISYLFSFFWPGLNIAEKFIFPNGNKISVTPDNKIVIMNSLINRFQVYRYNGNFIRGKSCESNSNLIVDKNNISIVNTRNGKVKKYSFDGDYVKKEYVDDDSLNTLRSRFVSSNTNYFISRSGVSETLINKATREAIILEHASPITYFITYPFPGCLFLVVFFILNIQLIFSGKSRKSIFKEMFV